MNEVPPGIKALAKCLASSMKKRLGKPCPACQTTGIMCPRCGEMAPLVKIVEGRHVFRCDCDNNEFAEACKP